MMSGRFRTSMLFFLLALAFSPALVQALAFDLVWEYTNNPSAPATGFYLRRSNVPDLNAFTGAPIAMSLAMRSYRDDGLVANSPYCYYLTAVNGAKESKPSNVVCTIYVPPPPQETPTEPTKLRGTWVPSS